MTTWDDKPNDYEHALVIIEGLRASNAELVEAMEPFARNVAAISLSKALGHIGREDLLRAGAAIAKANGEARA